MDSKIKNLLEVQDNPFFRQDFLEIRLTQNRKCSFKDFSLALLQDCQEGVFRQYDNPVLKTNFQEILMQYHERTFVLGEISLTQPYTNTLLKELEDYVKRGACSVSYFRIGDNWKGKFYFDIVGFFHQKMEKNYPRLILSKKTQTRHLRPFLNAEISEGYVELGNGKDRKREAL